MNQAFILGAGLGTRLRPLTSRLPKPLVPLFHRPLACWAVDACKRAGIHRFAINTHHLPECWDTFTRDSAGSENISLFHEPILLETGGGLKNIASWIGKSPLLVHNGDIYSDLPLNRLIAAHESSGLPVTLALRSSGEAKHIALDPSQTRVTDIRRKLGRSEGTHVFTGIYCVNPEFLELLPQGEKISIIPGFLQLAEQDRLGAVIIDDGTWLDLGDRDSYLQAHRELDLGPTIHPLAVIAPSATIIDSVVGPGAVVGPDAVLKGCVVWPESRVSTGACLERCIVFSDQPATGHHTDRDL